MNQSETRIGEIIGNVDSATATRSFDSPNQISLTICGWLIHSLEPIVDLYLEAPKALKTKLEAVNRPDLASQFPGILHAPQSGYQVTFQYSDQELCTPLTINIFGTLASGALIQSQVEVPIALPSAMVDAEKTEGSVSHLNEIALRAFLNSQTRIMFPSALAPLLSIIIVTFNRAAESLRCLQALELQINDSHEIIIIDNNSSDSTGQLLNRVEGARVVHNAENRHFLLASNQGAKLARGKFLLFLNSDTQVLSGALTTLLDSFRDHPFLGALGARLIHPTGTLQEVGSHLLADGSAIGIGVGENTQGLPFLFQRAVDFCSGAFLATPRKLWEKLGGFDEAFAPAYYEDADYCLRIRALGFEVLVEPRITVIHNEGAIGANAAQATELMQRNREKMIERHADFFKKHRSLSLPPQIIQPPLYADPYRVLIIDDFYPLEQTGQGAPRTQIIVNTLLENGYRITILALNELKESPTQGQTPDLEILALKNRTDALLEFLALRGGSFGTMIISRPHNMEAFLKIKEKHPACARNAHIIYDAEAISALREIRSKQTLASQVFTEFEIEKIVSLEILSVKRADQIWVTSQAEQEEFIRRGVEAVYIASYGVTLTQTKAHFESRKNGLFLGPLTAENGPNGEGFLWFMKEVFPEIQLPSFCLNHVGKDNLKIKFSPSEVVYHGVCEDLSPFFESMRIFIAPIRFGAGIPLKVIQAAAQGLPIVTTPYVAEQLGWSDGEEILVGRTAPEFGAKMVELYTNQALWTSLRERALSRVYKDYDLSNFKKTLAGLLSIESRLSKTNSLLDSRWL